MESGTSAPPHDGGNGKSRPQEETGFSIVFGGSRHPEAFFQLAESLKALLTKQHGALPKGGLIQASGDRPVWVSRKVLAAELRLALDLVPTIRTQSDSWTGSMEVTDVANVGDVHESCRTMVDGLARYADKDDRDLMEAAWEIVSAVRNLDRASRSRAESYLVDEGIQSARANLKSQYDRLIRKLAEETGDRTAATDR